MVAISNSGHTFRKCYSFYFPVETSTTSILVALFPTIQVHVHTHAYIRLFMSEDCRGLMISFPAVFLHEK